MTRLSLLVPVRFSQQHPWLWPRVLLCAGVVLSAGLFGGCQRPLFPEGEPRTQYDRYDLIRNEYAEPFVRDEFGQRRPNLRGRLLPRD